MKKIHSTGVLAGALAIAASFSASANPVHATFSGSVNGASSFNTSVLADFPVGTLASFDVTFDNSSLTPTVPTSLNIGPVAGTVQLGAYEWTIDAGYVSSYSFTTPDNQVLWYGLQLTGTGPSISSGGSLFGLFMQLTPDMDPFSSSSFMVGFGYPVEFGTFYSYATLAGEYSVSNSTAVPEPEVAFMLLPGLAMLWGSRRRAKKSAA